VAWPLVANSIEFGGLGVLELERFSRALQLRWSEAMDVEDWFLLTTDGADGCTPVLYVVNSISLLLI
jgi:hypothetical protein